MIIERELKIKEIIQRTHNVKSFRLETSDDIEFKAGQYMMVTLNSDKEISRFLSISNSPTEKGYIEFTKKMTGSDFCKALERLKLSDTVKIKCAFGKFTFEGEYDKIAFLSGGIGITPIRSICRFVIDKNLETDIILIYGNQSVNDIAFKEDFEKMQEEYQKLKIVHVLCDDKNCDFPIKRGFITKEIIIEVIPDYEERKFYLCGPSAMVDAMMKILIEELSLPKVNIITESFRGY